MGRHGRAAWGIALTLVCLLLAACDDPAPAQPEAPTIRLGVGSTNEQEALAGLTQAALMEAGLQVEMVWQVGDTVALRREATRDNIDLYWDYSGAAWSLGLRRAAPSPDPEESYEAVASADVEEGLRWLPPSDVNATLTLFVRAGERPEGEGGTLSWLARQLATVSGGICADQDYLDSPTGYEVLAETYSIADDVALTPARESKAVTNTAEGQCYAALATATSALARNAGLLPLVDDEGIFPAFVAAPVARIGSTADTPEVTAALEPITEALDNSTLAGLSGRVARGEDALAIGQGFLQ